MDQLQDIVKVIDCYFAALYQGDVNALMSTFHAKATLSGEVNGQPYFKTLAEYVDVVINRKSPQDLGEAFAMKILSIEILNHIALVKTHCPMLGFNYFDYLAMIYQEGKWMIVSKVFINT